MLVKCPFCGAFGGLEFWSLGGLRGCSVSGSGVHNIGAFIFLPILLWWFLVIIIV